MEIIYLMISTLFIRCQSGLTELHKDRFVLREYTSFEMDCNHNLEKLTRIKWDFNSNPTNDNKTETIYESWHPDKILKSGFEVSCELHETLISKCSLKLVQTRKEDSGKYICYVEQEDDAEFDSNALKPVTEIELVVRGPSNKTMLANKDDRVILPCEHNIKNLTRARWSHVSTKGVLTYAIYHMPAKETSNKNYEVQCEPHELYCNLKILKANKESAGKYICKVGESQEFEKKYGLDSLTHFIEIELVVGELECNENMKKELTFLGENDCYGIEADVLNLKCSFNYFGNINYNLLHLRWIEKNKFNSLEKKLNSSPINHEVKDETKKISIQTNLSVAYEMQNSIFQCVLDDIQVKPCQLHEFRTQYVKNTTESPPSLYSNDLQNKICLVQKSQNVECSYFWVHESPGSMAENPHAMLPVENMKSLGIYKCFATCVVGNHKTHCIIKATEFKVIHVLHTSGLIGLIVIPIILVLAALIVVIVLRKKKDLFCKTNRRKEITEHEVFIAFEVEHENMSLLDQKKQQETIETNVCEVGHKTMELLDQKKKQEGRNEENVEHETVELLDQKKQEGKHEEDVEHETVKLLDQKKQEGRNEEDVGHKNQEKQQKRDVDEDEITRLSQAPINPLKVKKMLHEKKTKHHEVKIYEANDNNYGKVLMIDGAMWDAELEKFSYQKMMTLLPIRSHPNPKKVLVIGGGEVRLVKELVKNPEVESITVCEVDEELLAMCRDYVPSWASSFDDDKVEIHMEDGFEFLKKTEDTFDVIINHSSNTEGPSKYLFTKEYYELVKSKLNERGVVATIVNGKDKSGSDVLEQTTMKFCNKLFPAVHYFYIPAFNHPSSLVRSLVCSLIEDIGFKQLFGKMNGEYALGSFKKRLDDPLKKLKKELEDHLEGIGKVKIKDLPKFSDFEKMFEKEMKKRKKLNDDSDSDDSSGDDSNSDDSDSDDSEDGNHPRLHSRKDTILNPIAKDFLDKIQDGRTILERERERSEKKIKVIRTNKGNYNPLTSRREILKEKSEFHDIVIYESVNHGKVFTLDNAFWVTEYDEFFQKIMFILPVIGHQEPNDVLVIGGGDGTIASKLLKHRNVKFITVYESDESIIKLSREHFPSFASSLKDPRVKLIIGDGFKFMKTQRKAFDVIISRSTNKYETSFGNEYFEVVKAALKEGGVSSLLIQGGGSLKKKVIKTRFARFLVDLFDDMQYFYLPCYDHPGSLIRCILCSLNPVIDFEKFFDEMTSQFQSGKRKKI